MEREGKEERRKREMEREMRDGESERRKSEMIEERDGEGEERGERWRE